MTVAILGAGKMGEALLAGLLRGGHDVADVVVTERHAERAAELTERYGVQVLPITDAVGGADTVVLAVKPQDMVTVLGGLGDSLRPATLVVSIAAGLTVRFLEGLLPTGTPVVRVMPNTPALVGEGMSAIAAGTSATDEHLASTERLLAELGPVRRVAEADLDAVTAVSGSGPAYVFYLAEAMVAAGVSFGLDPETAAALTTQTIVGAGVLLRESGQSPRDLRAAVTSKGGTTAAAVAVLDDRGVAQALAAAITACRDRSVELANG